MPHAAAKPPFTPFFHNPEFVIFILNNLNHKQFDYELN